MQKIPSSVSGFFNVPSLLASSLCGVGALLAVASLTMGPPSATAQTTSGARIFVTTTVQKIGGIGTGGCSLQEAIYSSVLTRVSSRTTSVGTASQSTRPTRIISSLLIASRVPATVTRSCSRAVECLPLTAQPILPGTSTVTPTILTGRRRRQSSLPR